MSARYQILEGCVAFRTSTGAGLGRGLGMCPKLDQCQILPSLLLFLLVCVCVGGEGGVVFVMGVEIV